jgi:hypothetical protein
MVTLSNEKKEFRGGKRSLSNEKKEFRGDNRRQNQVL